MDFFTKVDIPASDLRIDYRSRIAFFGSCFADNISKQFSARKFNVLANPFGTVYNPASIARQIKAIADGKVFEENDIFMDERCDGLWHCWDAHSSLSGATRKECIDKMNTANSQAREFLKTSDVVFLTLGTAFVYYLKDGDKPVSNCHRQDPSRFTRRMISIEDAADALRESVAYIRQLNSNARIVFTVSPLRHMGDGPHNNTLSKATLQLAINRILPRHGEQPKEAKQSSVEYFTSYEIVMDELRDYRFYDSDMVHLSKSAEEYIFERMTETYCDEHTRTDIVHVEKFMKMANHRIQDTDSHATAMLKAKIKKQAIELERQIPGLDLSSL